MKNLLIITVLLASLSSFAQEKKTTAVAPEVKMMPLSTGITVEYAEQGDKEGTPVILLHGICDSWRSFETVLPHLPKNIRAFALSQRGHGGSDKPMEGYDAKNFAEDISAFLTQQKLDQAVIVGHSMGGVVAQEFASRYPHMVKALVILASDACSRNNKGMPEFYQEAMNLKGNLDREFMVEFQKACLKRSIDEKYFNTLVDENMKVPVRVFQGAFTGIMSTDYREAFRNFNKPVMIVWGEDDAFFHREGQQVLQASFNNEKFYSYSGHGHGLHWESPERFAADLVAFISGNDSSPETQPAER
jgi:non-heme chloroperoxidase